MYEKNCLPPTNRKYHFFPNITNSNPLFVEIQISPKCLKILNPIEKGINVSSLFGNGYKSFCGQLKCDHKAKDW